jgi:SAM-dependent methyltransferase
MCAADRHALHRAAGTADLRPPVVRCAGCGFVFVAEVPQATYRPVQDAPQTVPELPRHRQIKRLCDRVLAPGPHRTRRLVEVGSGWGGLAQVLSRDDRYEYIGFEPSASRADFCRARGFDVRAELFRGAASAGVADAVVIDNVLEHVAAPADLIRDAVAALRPGGLLVVIVPNLRDMRQLHPRWRQRHHWQPHCHINYFSAGRLRELFRRCAMEMRFFGLDTLTAGDWRTAPRVLADGVGLHLFGLNCFGIKPGTAAGTGG